MIIYYACLFTAIFIGVIGQISLKTGSLHAASANLPGISGIILFQPFIILGLSCYFASAIFYMYSLKQIPLSVAFPSVSLSYVVVALLAHFIWNEPFGSQHMIAIFFILLGVLLLVRA
ncbi:MAG: EamA family transporter [Gammaproteobacteria bacterium]